MFSDLVVNIGVTSGGLPSIVIQYGGNSYELIAGMLTNTTVSIIGWAREVVGYGIIGGAIIKSISNIHNLLSGEANLIGDDKI